MTRIRRNPEDIQRLQVLVQNPNISRFHMQARPDSGSDVVQVLAVAAFFGGLFYLAGWAVTGRNIERAALASVIGCIAGFTAWTAYLLYTKRISAEFIPRPDREAQPTEPAEPPFIQLLNEDGGFSAARVPEGWQLSTMRRYAQYSKAGNTYDIAYNKRPDWVTADMLKALRGWLVERGYGREHGERKAWEWYPSGVRNMDRWATDPPHPLTAPLPLPVVTEQTRTG